jgi:hypothetical protein
MYEVKEKDLLMDQGSHFFPKTVYDFILVAIFCKDTKLQGRDVWYDFRRLQIVLQDIQKELGLWIIMFFPTFSSLL